MLYHILSAFSKTFDVLSKTFDVLASVLHVSRLYSFICEDKEPNQIHETLLHATAIQMGGT